MHSCACNIFEMSTCRCSVSILVGQTEEKIHKDKKKLQDPERKNRGKEREGKMKVARTGEINKKG